MIIENSVNDESARALILGCFPKNVLSFQDSQDFFQQIVFIDYEMLLLIESSFNGNELDGSKVLLNVQIGSVSEKIDQLLNYIRSIAANYSSKPYEEILYYLVVVAHLNHLKGDNELFAAALNEIRDLPKPSFNSTVMHEFAQYLFCRYCALYGLIDVKYWINYLRDLSPEANNSHVALMYWRDLIFSRLAQAISRNGSHLISYSDIKSQEFFSNRVSTINFCGYLLSKEKYLLLDPKFKSEFSHSISEEIEKHLSQKNSISDATSGNDDLDSYVGTLYNNLMKISDIDHILKYHLSKKFLISCMSRTYQSRIVLSNLVKVLIHVNEYDEAIAAFKIYISYEKKEQVQGRGHIDDIVSVVDLYSFCIEKFNPLKSIIGRAEASQKFKYTNINSVLKSLKEFIEDLKWYLNTLSDSLHLSYDEEDSELADNPLSFLIQSYNPHAELLRNATLPILISKGWFSIGYYYYYLSIYNASNYEQLEGFNKATLEFYKRCLIIEPNGSLHYAFNYALVLAHSKKLKPALKFCKHILKHYPESFKTWNLLVLLMSSFETNNPATFKTKNNEDKVESNGTIRATSLTSLRELEKFINNALNISSIYIIEQRNQMKTIHNEAKHEILQLKLTQLAVWESIYGTQYILEFISEVFLLYNELFDLQVEKNHKTISAMTSEARWSHRPSFIDPHPTVPSSNGTSVHGNIMLSDKMKKLSQPKEKNKKPINNAVTSLTSASDKKFEQSTLQEIWLWTASIYLRSGSLEDAEQCIVEAESAFEPNFKTFTALGLLTSKERKFLSLQEYEKSLEVLSSKNFIYNKKDYGNTLLGLGKLFILDDELDNSLFISNKDMNAGIIRLKNLLEKFTLSWPYGHNDSEIWWILSKIYEKIDDKVMLNKSLWNCIDLEDYRPVRKFECCETFHN
ncbi:uncharacterized protein PRCAT00000400001 [Priceomyces carsonii]|uniref:uncharacterized protein n=1 Tax=Priceomyces carsonii TaxID=28549 RepID=UPI002ED7D08F|nr:unnamed protein product [Priceomyces carsonii]